MGPIRNREETSIKITIMSPERWGRDENASKESMIFPAVDAMCMVSLGVIPTSLPMIHVIVVTHFLGCVEIEIIGLFLSWHQGD